MEFDYNVNLVFDCHFYGKKFQDGCQITRKLHITYFYDWPLHIKTAEDMLPQSCTLVQISRPDPTHENRDPTRPDDYPWWAKRPYYCTMHTVKRLYPGDQQHAKDYPVILHSRRYISCFQRHCTVTTECRLTCTLKTSVVWLSSYLLWFVHGLAIKKSLLNNS